MKYWRLFIAPNLKSRAIAPNLYFSAIAPNFKASPIAPSLSFHLTLFSPLLINTIENSQIVILLITSIYKCMKQLSNNSFRSDFMQSMKILMLQFVS